MFGNNQKISGRQLERLLVLDWIGKAGLLIPGFSGYSGGRAFLFSLLLAVGLTLCYAWLLGRLAHRIENDFYGYVCYRLGRPAAVFLSLAYWMYAFVNTLFLLRLFAAVAVTFVLPETKEWILIVIAAGAGIYAASGGLEVRARFGEVLFPAVVWPLLLLLVFAARSVRLEYVIPQYTSLTMDAVCTGARMFSAFGGIGLFLYVAPSVDSRKRASRAMFRGVTVTLAGEFILFLMILGTFGEQGMKALPWPLVTLMSSVKIPGEFLQRWDVIFTVLLLGSFFTAVTTGMYYLNLLTEEIFGGKKRRANLLLPAAAVTAAACVCREYDMAVKLYTVWNGCIFLPITVFFTLLLALLEYKKTGRFTRRKDIEEQNNRKSEEKSVCG